MLRFVDQEDPTSEPVRFQKMQREREANPAPSFGAESLDLTTPEMEPGPGYFPGKDLMRDKYIRQNPGSGITRLPAGEQGPSQGPYTPVQRIPGMGWGPDGREAAPDFQRPVRQA